MEKQCAECGIEIRGRADKKFCSDQCRNSFNNRANRTDSAIVKKTNTILRRNRKILAGLNPDGKRKVHRDMLLKAGFDFDHLTSIRTTRAGKSYRFCYEHGYLDLGSDFYLLVVQDD